MTRNPREILNELNNGMGEIAKKNPEQFNTFMNFAGAVLKEGAIDAKTKELISVAVGTYSRCEYCIVAHVYNALNLGATEDEIMEAAMISGAFAGGPAVANTASPVKQSIDEFAKDFQK